MNKLPFAISAKSCLNIISRIAACVAYGPISDFEIDHFSRSAIDKMMGVTGACFEPRTHAGLHLRFPGTGDQRWFPLEDIDEFVLS